MKYRAKYFIKTPASIESREAQQNVEDVHSAFLEFPVNPVSMSEYLWSTEDGDSLYMGMYVDVLVSASSKQEAKKISSRKAVEVASVVSFITNSKVQMPEFRSVVEYQEKEKNEFEKQMDIRQERPIISSLRQIESEELIGLYSNILTDDLSDSDRRKIFRSLRAYMKSLQQELTDDEFSWLYMSLDAIEPLLRETYPIEDDRMYKQYTCEECGGEAAEKINNDAGKEELAERSDQNIDLDDISQARHNLFHSAKISEELDNIEGLRKLVRKGILDILGLEEPLAEEIRSRNYLGMFLGDTVQLTGKLVGYNPKPLDSTDRDKMPVFKIKGRAENYNVEDGNLQYSPRIDINTQVQEGTRIDDFEFGVTVRGDLGGNIEASNLDIEKKD